MKKKILQIGSYPPPMGGVSMRIKALKEYLVELGYECVVLRVGEGMRVKADGCINVNGMLDFAIKVFKYLIDGYVVHMHINGKSMNYLFMALYTQGLSAFFFQKGILNISCWNTTKIFSQK